MAEAKKANLYCREGGSDKVYNVQLTAVDGGWSVDAQNGARGKALKAQPKGVFTDFAVAEKVYDDLVKSKVKKGYTPEESGAAFAGTEFAGRDTGVRPQLLNEIEREDALHLGAEWLVQEKHDGERRTMIGDATGIRFGNRKGLEVGVQQPIHDGFTRLHEVIGGKLVLDAEDMGNHVVVFDVIEHFMISEGSFRERSAILAHLQKTITSLGLGEALRVDVPVAAPEFFARHLAALETGGAEGFVMRRADSLYVPGRPNNGGAALKVKFWADISCIVTEGRDGKRSVGLDLIDEHGGRVPVGNVTIPANATVPARDTVIDVRYLYAHKGGSLFQPTFQRHRPDVSITECVTSKVKYKAGNDFEPEPETNMSLGM
ncbi:hypothetical protein ACEUZ9_001064 [Paracoccus litorisediminis]|uniref:hypothetical protein n=1 Tax=Paracoccus litorisediminis TaxID=2006130 RepID=UPI00372FAC61